MNLLKQIGLRNVRTFKGTLSLFNLPQMTVFCGANGSGKSTVLKSLLLLRQSQGINEIYGNDKREGMLRFVGSQVNLGDYSGLVSANQISRDINIHLVVASPNLRAAISNLPRNFEDSSVRRYHPDAFNLKVDLSFKTNAPRPLRNDQIDRLQSLDLLLDDLVREPQRSQGILDRAKFSVVAKGRELASWTVKRVYRKGMDPYYRLNIPGDGIALRDRLLSFPASRDSLREKRIKGEITESSVLKGISVAINLEGLFPVSIKGRDFTSLLPRHVAAAGRALHDALEGINYLAPLRTASQRYYLTEYDATPGLDPRGDFLPYMLSEIAELPEIVHIPPRQKNPIRQNPRDALNGWLRYLNTGAGFNTKSRNDEFVARSVQGKVVEINLKGHSGTTKHSISDSGFGYSQVLPILVKGLLAAPGSTLIVEQPELHLNPALQVRLADFFVSMTRAGKQVIIETHSEHIVNTIRVRTVQDSDGFLSSNSVIYFLDNEKGRPVTHELSIQEDGTVPGWPYKFFGEALDLSGQLMMAQADYIKKRQGE